MLAVIKVRGNIGISPELKKTSELLKLRKPNQMVLVEETHSNKKMVEKVKDYVTFGEIDLNILLILV